MSSTTVRLRRKGIITLPIELRNRYNLAEGDLLTLEDLGGGIFLLIPRISHVTRLGDQVATILKEEGIGAEEILTALEENRKAYYQEHFTDS